MAIEWYIRTNSLRWPQGDRATAAGAPCGRRNGAVRPPQVRSIARSSPYGCRTVALWWPWCDSTVFSLTWVSRNHTSTVRWLHGCRAINVRWFYDLLNILRQPCSPLTAAVRCFRHQRLGKNLVSPHSHRKAAVRPPYGVLGILLDEWLRRCGSWRKAEFQVKTMTLKCAKERQVAVRLAQIRAAAVRFKELRLQN